MGSCPGVKKSYLQSRYTLKCLLFTPPTFSFTGMVVTNERAQGVDRWLTQRPRGKGCLSRVPYIVGFICVLVQSASWGAAMHHALNKLSSPCSELLAGERVIRSDAIRDLRSRVVLGSDWRILHIAFVVSTHRVGPTLARRSQLTRVLTSRKDLRFDRGSKTLFQDPPATLSCICTYARTL